MDPVLHLQHVSKSYPVGTGVEPLTVLHDVSFQVLPGESIAVVGPSGSGKSTLLNILGTLDRPSSGQITFDGLNLTQLDDLALAEVRNNRIGFIFQSHHLLPHCNVLENVLVPTLARSSRIRPSQAIDRARKLLDRVGLSHRLSHRPSQLSGGERQRVAVVRALINEPKMILADEPTGALDQTSAHNLASMLVELNHETGITLIVVTHAPNLAARMARRFETRDGTLREA